VTKVASSFNKSLTLNYDSAGLRLTSVNDGTRTVSYNYNAAGDLTNVVDAGGFTWFMGYDGNHGLTSVTDPDGTLTMSNYYNTQYQVTNQISGVQQPWTYYVTGKETIEQDPNGNQTTYFYDDQGRTISVQTADGAQTYTSYDGQDHVIQTVDARGVTNQFQYDGNQNLISATNAVGTLQQRVTAMVYDSQFQLVAVTNAVGTTIEQATTYDYNPTHHVKTIIDPTGTQQNFTYQNGLRQSFSVVSAAGATLNSGAYTYDNTYGYMNTAFLLDSGTTTYHHDTIGNLVSMTDPLGNPTTFTYDGRRLLKTATDAKGGVMSRSYYKTGLLQTEINPRGFTNTYTWTPVYKVSTVAMPDGRSVSNVYDAANRLIATRNGQYWTTNQLDAVGRVTNTVFGANRHRFTYDANGNTLTVRDALSNLTSNQYDALNQLTWQQLPIGQQQFVYDPLGRVTTLVDALTHPWQSEYDPMGRLTRRTRPSTAYEQYGYDGQGNRTSFVSADTHSTHFTFDAQSRLKQVNIDPGWVTTYNYDAAGNLKSRQDALNRTNNFYYDTLNRLTNTVYADGAQESLSYDANSNITTARTSQSTIILSYDNSDRLSSVSGQVNSASWSVAYGYDANGNTTNIVYPGGLSVAYAFDEQDRVHTVSWNSNTATFTYNDAGQLTVLAYPNGVTATYGYDGMGRMTSLQYTKGSDLVARTITRNALGYKTQENINAGLSPSPTTTRVKHQSYDTADRLQTSTDQQGITTTYTSDANGNLNWISSSQRLVSYTWDCADRLVTITNWFGGATNVTGFLYDAMGYRLGRTGAAPTYFVLNYRAGLKNVLAQLDLTGGLARRYIWGPSGLICQIEPSGTNHYVHADDQGSTLAMTDDNGNVTDQFAYTPYGELTAQTGTTGTPYQWLGGLGVRKEGTNTYAMQRRFYSFEQKRFLSADPSGVDSFPNLYAYGNVNPGFYTDPYGLSAEGSGSVRMAGLGRAGLGGLALWGAIGLSQFTPAGWAADAALVGGILFTAPNISAGLTQTVTGSPVKPYTVSVLEQVPGFDEDIAENINSFGLVGLSMFGTLPRNPQSTQPSPAPAASSSVQFSVADVKAAIARLEARGVQVSEVQSSIDPNQVIAIAKSMQSGSFQNQLMDSPVIMEQASQAILAGTHRTIAAEMTGFNLNVNVVSTAVSPVPLTSVPLRSGRVNPVIRTW
jgi:RHS repeat-associated protein